MQEINSNERLTWAEIVEKYPHKWVGVADAELEGGNIRSGIVKYVDDSDTEIFERQIKFGDVETEYTTPDDFCGVLNSGLVLLPEGMKIVVIDGNLSEEK